MSQVSGPRRRRKDRHGALADAAVVLTERRLALGLTQIEVADLAGVGLSSVRAVEAGQTTVTLAVTLAVLDALGLAAAIGPRPTLRALSDTVVLEPTSRPPLLTP